MVSQRAGSRTGQRDICLPPVALLSRYDPSTLRLALYYCHFSLHCIRANRDGKPTNMANQTLFRYFKFAIFFLVVTATIGHLGNAIYLGRATFCAYVLDALVRA